VCPPSLRPSRITAGWIPQQYAESSHAEAFYFQKQIHSRTVMIFVLEDGEQIEGTIEWYDRNAIKVRHGALRTLIYKAGIKYLYKAADTNQLNGRP
jgi:sRNA-binding regulator protein Hfq